LKQGRLSRLLKNAETFRLKQQIRLNVAKCEPSDIEGLLMCSRAFVSALISLTVLSISRGDSPKQTTPTPKVLKGLFPLLLDELQRQFPGKKIPNTEVLEEKNPIVPEIGIQVASQRLVVKHEGVDSKWRGDVTLEIKQAYRVYFCVDEDEVRKGDIRWESKTRTLHLRMPNISLGPIETLDDDSSNTIGEAKYDALRGSALGITLDKDTKAAILQRAFPEMKRKITDYVGTKEYLNKVRDTKGRDVLTSVLRRYIEAVDPEAKLDLY
jgi:hypothetical protein